MKGKKYFGIVTLFYIFCMCILCGCKKGEQDSIPAPVDYTIVAPADIPKELKERIDENKEKSFGLTFSDMGYMYIVYGYGKQSTGGYSIVMKELSYLDGALYFDCELKGPAENEAVNRLPSYPYIVIKTEDCSANVIFR